MVSEFETRFLADAVPALQAEHGESFERWPCGVEGAAETVTGCLWTPDDVEPQSNYEAEQSVLTGTLEVPATQDVHREDVWVIEEEHYAANGEPVRHAGMWAIELKHVAKVHRTRHGVGEMS